MEHGDDALIVVLDDSFEDRFFLRRTIRKVKPDAVVLEFTYAKEALDFLLAREGKDAAGKVVLFADINIPRMDGFEFLDAYTKRAQGADEALVVMMSNSIDPMDRERANALPIVHSFETKPVAQPVLQKIFSGLSGAGAAPGA